jgi:septal ring factor EnvC (AmiA/AmiB activator)
MRPIERWRLRRATPLAGLALASAALVGSLALAQDRRESQVKLDAVRNEIEELTARIARETTRRDDGAKALRAAELTIAAATRKLAEVSGNLRTQQGARRELRVATERANERLAAERAALARQVRASYMAGRDELTKLLLSQESPATLGRMLVYFDYYNRARTTRIAAVAADLAQLDQLAAETARVEAELAALEEAQRGQVAQLSRSRDERRAAVARIDAEIRDGEAEVAKLRAEEQRLTELVERLGELMAGFPVDLDEPFASLKGKLEWPVQGRLAGDYGQSRGARSVRSRGVLLEAPAGTPVRAVYHGRVAFADWLQGLGLLVIVDHGGGYMSLYAHNEALLKESGDWVAPGEAIAQVGDTGGQARPALYFELRHDGEPVNPHPWIARGR